MTAREALIEKIVAEGCDGHGSLAAGDYEHHSSDDCPDGDGCAQCDCWAHVAGRALDEWDELRADP